MGRVGVQELDFSPLTSPELEPAFWTPERLDRHSAWWGHVPFAFWLVANVEPRLLVELGTHHGVSYAAFCEAVLRRRLATRCYAVDAWKGDSHAGVYDEDVYADLKEFHDRRYASFSQLARKTFDEASADFDDGSIDLLHIDGYHSYEAVRNDFDTWRPKLSDRGVVLFHDTNERQLDFGVWRFFAELKGQVPTFEFLHSHGLAVAAVGSRAPEAAKWLCGLSEAEIVAVRERFCLLGARWEAARQKEAQAKALAEASAQHARLAAVIVEKDNAIAGFREAVDKAEARLPEQEDRVNNMQSVMAAKDIEIAEGRKQSLKLESLVAERDARLTESEGLLVKQSDHIARLQSEVERLSATIARAEDVIHHIAQKFSGAMKKRSLRQFRHALKVQFFRLPVRTSRYSLIRDSVFFDKNYYLQSNPDVKAQKLDPVVHYLGFGAQEGRDPGPHFSEAGYRALSPDLALTSVPALEHYESHGRTERRRLLAVEPRVNAPDRHDAGMDTIAASAFDPHKKTILIVSHDASRTGAPILALNLVQRFSERYNVIGLVLGGGELIDHFLQASTSLVVAHRVHMTDGELDRVIADITSRRPLSFAIANSVESRRVLRPLKVAGVPTVSLVHEFSADTRPRSAFPDVLSLSTRTVFSTKATLEDVASDFWLYPSSSIHIAPQGKCVVPASSHAPKETANEKAWLKQNLRPQGVGRKFLVIGVGTISLRKGVDLFFDCATIIKNGPGGERFQFVWIGDDPYPETPYSLSLFLTDQFKRANLEPQMKIVRTTSQIELAYELADLLIVSSRLDPLPNTATEALTSGLPVLCFERTTGIAHFLSENGLGDLCVAKYLDTRDLARKALALADDDELRAKVSERSRAAAESTFDMSAYVSKIEAIAAEAIGNESRLRHEVETILASKKFRSDFFKHAGLDGLGLSEEQIIGNYLYHVASGIGIRKPMPGFHPTVFSMLHASEGRAKYDPFVDFLQRGLPEGPWLQKVIQDGVQRKAGTRAALHLHAFYPDLVPGVVKRLHFNASSPDLFVSVCTSEAAAEVRKALHGYRGRLCDLQVTPNLGRDFGPLLTQFGRTLCDEYDIIGHLHTKKSLHVADRSYAEAWSAFLLENLIGGERGGAMFDAILSAMELDSEIGLVFPDDPHVMSWTHNRRVAEDLATRMNLGDLPEQFNFPIGSMFWVRSSVLSRFVELDLAWSDYPPEPIPIDGTLVHAFERLFGVVPATMGMRCAVTNIPGLTR